MMREKKALGLGEKIKPEQNHSPAMSSLQGQSPSEISDDFQRARYQQITQQSSYASPVY